jgi:hypothetical protein
MVINSYKFPKAVFTLDEALPSESREAYGTCKSCQCACHLCRGHRNPTKEVIGQAGIEELFEEALAA